jgi:hypothetical protein
MRKPCWCQRITVAGWTMRRTERQFGQSQDSQAQKIRSRLRRRGLSEPCLRTASCCRRARFSAASSAWLRTAARTKMNITFTQPMPRSQTSYVYNARERLRTYPRCRNGQSQIPEEVSETAILSPDEVFRTHSQIERLARSALGDSRRAHLLRCFPHGYETGILSPIQVHSSTVRKVSMARHSLHRHHERARGCKPPARWRPRGQTARLVVQVALDAQRVFYGRCFMSSFPQDHHES